MRYGLISFLRRLFSKEKTSCRLSNQGIKDVFSINTLPILFHSSSSYQTWYVPVKFTFRIATGYLSDFASPGMLMDTVSLVFFITYWCIKLSFGVLSYLPFLLWITIKLIGIYHKEGDNLLSENTINYDTPDLHDVVIARWLQDAQKSFDKEKMLSLNRTSQNIEFLAHSLLRQNSNYEFWISQEKLA